MGQNELVLNKYRLNINVLKCMLSSSGHMQKMNEDQNCKNAYMQNEWAERKGRLRKLRLNGVDEIIKKRAEKFKKQNTIQRSMYGNVKLRWYEG